MSDAWVVGVIVFLLGAITGAKLEARLWRGKAVDGFRMSSGGKLYNVTEDRS